MKKERAACCVAGTDCESPAGWQGYYGYATNRNLKRIENCLVCGEPVCSLCSIEGIIFGETGRICTYCQRDYKYEINTAVS